MNTLTLYRMPDEVSGGAIEAVFVLAINGIHILRSTSIHGFSTVSPEADCPPSLFDVARSMETALQIRMQYRDARPKARTTIVRGAGIKLVS